MRNSETGLRPDRRAFLRAAALTAGGAALFGGRADADTPAGRAPPGLIIRGKEPENLEFPFDTSPRRSSTPRRGS
jgi:hypothetical protein